MFARNSRIVIVLVVLAILGGQNFAHAQDRIGIYWDPAFTNNETTTAAPFEVLDAYIVISDPSVGGGILAWECEVGIDGPGMATGWSIEGQAINAQSPPRFAVGLASPLPPATVTQVASFQLIVTEVQEVNVTLSPIFFASIPNEMAYLGNDLPEQLTVMTPVTNNQIVATVNASDFDVSVDRTHLDFGAVALTVDNTRFVRVTNVGGGLLPLEISLACDGPGYSLDSVSGAWGVGPGETVIIPVTFTPSVLGLVTCTLNLGPHAPDVVVTGSGREPITSWAISGDVDFSLVFVGNSREITASFRNTGDLPLELDVGWIDTCDGALTVSNLGPQTVLAGTTIYHTFRYAPITAGATACVMSYGPGFPSINVTGNSVIAPPDVLISPESITFLPQTLGTTEAQIIRITNTGSNPLPIDPQLTNNDSPIVLGAGAEARILQPGNRADIQVLFTPTSNGYFGNSLELAPGIVPISIEGTGGPEIRLCQMSTELLEFQVGGIGASQTKAFTVNNPGNVSLPVRAYLPNGVFSVEPSAPFSLIPGMTVTFEVTYTPTDLGVQSALISLGPDVCSSVALRGFAAFDIQPGENQIGFFFDSNFSAIETGIAGSSTTVPVYLALLNPSETSGVAGWECRVETTGGAEFVGWDLAGDAINVPNLNDPSEFTVGIGLEPLPYAASGVLLATFQLHVFDDNPNNVTLELHPNRTASIPGFMAWVPWSDVTQLTPMVTTTGQPTVAWINTGVPVGVETPTPLAVQLDGQIDLEWPMRAANGDGYHVYRQDPAGREDRLTETPLPATTSTVRFSDRPDYPGGTVLRYSYAVVRDGAELVRSPAIEVTVKSLPQVRTQLLSNVPNPFNPQTEIRFQLATASQVRITIYDVTGRLVRTLVNEQRGAGENHAVWQGRDDSGRRVSSGAYYVRLENEGQIDHRKIMMLK